MRFGDRLANRKPKPQARAALLMRELNLKERIEDVPPRPRINADACIAKFDGQPISVVTPRFNGDLPTPGCVFDSVLDQVPKDLLEPAGISVRKMPRRGGREHELESFAIDLRPAYSNRLPETQVHIDCFPTQFELPAGYACDVEEIIDEMRFQIESAAHDCECAQILGRAVLVGGEIFKKRNQWRERGAQFMRKRGEE